jgi:orotidine-5'-phosphate decarboxylase
VEFIEKDEIVKELKEFEREFEREKIVDMKFCYINKTIFLYLLIYLVHHLL